MFRQNCTPCHRLRDEGNEVGPDVSMLGDKPPQYFLEAILDPSKAVEATTSTSFTGMSLEPATQTEFLGLSTTSISSCTHFVLR